MNRKIKWLASFFVLLLAVNTVLTVQEGTAGAAVRGAVHDAIPEDAIRLRILANSDSIADQTLKRKIRDAVAADIAEWVRPYDSKAEAAAVIQAKIPEIEAVVRSVMDKRNQVQPFTVELTETEFPAKLYGNRLYAAGTYDALKIVLGEGAGANWWCVLFPPLCFLDFGTSSTGADESEEAEASADEQTHTEEEIISEEASEEPTEESEPVKVRFFLLDWFSGK